MIIPPNRTSLPLTTYGHSFPLNSDTLSTDEKITLLKCMKSNQFSHVTADFYLRFGSQILNNHTLLSFIKFVPSSENPVQRLQEITEEFCNFLVHVWGIDASAEILGKSKHFSGSHSHSMHLRLADSVESFFSKNPLLSELEQSQLNTALLESFQYQKKGLRPPDAFRNYHEGKLITIGTGWRGHSIELSIDSVNRLLIYTNRGERQPTGNRMSSHEPESTVIIYKITKPLTLDFFDRIISTTFQASEHEVKEQQHFYEGTGVGSMRKMFGLEVVGTFPASFQKILNCTWANAKGGAKALLFFLALRKAQHENPSLSEIELINMCKPIAQQQFKAWQDFCREETLLNFLSLENEVLHQETALSAEGFYSFISEVGAKIAFKPTYQDSERNISKNRDVLLIGEYLVNSLIPIESCFIINGRSDLLKFAKAGSFYLDKVEGTKRIFFKNFNQEVVSLSLEDYTDVKTLGDLVRAVPFDLYLPVGFQNLDYYSRKNAEITKKLQFKETREQALIYLAKKNVGMMTMFPDKESGGIILGFKLPSHISSLTGKLITEVLVTPLEIAFFVGMYQRTPQGQFNLLKELRFAFDTVEEAKLELSQYPEKKKVLYREASGGFALLFADGQQQKVTPYGSKAGGLMLNYEKAKEVRFTLRGLLPRRR